MEGEAAVQRSTTRPDRGAPWLLQQGPLFRPAAKTATKTCYIRDHQAQPGWKTVTGCLVRITREEGGRPDPPEGGVQCKSLNAPPPPAGPGVNGK